MKAGFIGLGAMGWQMAGHLARKELLGGVWNRSPGKADRFAQEHGVRAVGSPAELWKTCEAVILCVSADQQVLEMVDRLDVAEARGKLVIDTSTVARETAIEAARELAGVGARFVDAPITGGTEGARNGTLTFMVGGHENDVKHAAPLLGAMGSRHVHMGLVGAGQATEIILKAIEADDQAKLRSALKEAEAINEKWTPIAARRYAELVNCQSRGSVYRAVQVNAHASPD
jgi:3-hydroxyisobutyrate dehydrogenase